MSATNGYPFLTKKAIASRVRSDREYALDTFRLLLARSAERTAETRGASGFMASHAGVVRELAATMEERPLNDAEHAKLAALLCHYTKQLAAHFRTIDLQARPELLQIASVFSAIPGAGPRTSDTTEGDDDGGDEGDAVSEGDVSADAEAPAIVEAPVRRRPGRPKGSRNRSKEEREKDKKRRGRRK